MRSHAMIRCARFTFCQTELRGRQAWVRGLMSVARGSVGSLPDSSRVPGSEINHSTRKRRGEDVDSNAPCMGNQKLLYSHLYVDSKGGQH